MTSTMATYDTRERLRRFIERAGASALILYMFGLSCAVPYYNVSYAADRGFGRWLLYGGFVATANGFLWPYFWILDDDSPFRDS
jgi:uncharacterized RDD family membrane protein YckC